MPLKAANLLRQISQICFIVEREGSATRHNPGAAHVGITGEQMVYTEDSHVTESRHSSAIPVEQNEDSKLLRHQKRRWITAGTLLGSILLVWLGLWMLSRFAVDESLFITAMHLTFAPLILWALVNLLTSSGKLRHLHRIFEPTWTYWLLLILLVFSVGVALPIVQGGRNGDSDDTAFLEVRIAAIFTLATFILVVIALFLQGKPSMRIERGRVVWRSSFGVATGFYAVLLLVAGGVAILEIALLADGVPDWVAYLGVVTFFLVILMLPVLIISVAVCSGAPYTSDSAAILVWAWLISTKKEKAKRLIKDLRDVTIVEYKQDNRRAVRIRLKALRDIFENDDSEIKQASLEEIGFVASEMILDRDLAREAIEALVSESKNRQRADTVDWRDSFINKQISELMSIWARAVEQKASPLLVDMCAKEIKNILGNGNFHRLGNLEDRGLDRKLDAIVAAYEDDVHEESGLLLTLKTFGHFKDFPDAVLDKLSEESKSPVKALTELFLETDKPNLDRYDRDVELFVKKSDNVPSKLLRRSIPFNSLRELAKKSNEHRKLIAKSCHWYVTDPETNATGQATANGYLALVLKMVKQSDPERLPDEAKQSLMDLMQIKAGGRKFQNWEPSQLRSIVTPNLMQLLPRNAGQLSARELARDETHAALRKVVVQLLVQSWGAHLEEQGESASESDKANQQWLLEQIRDFVRSLPPGKTDWFQSVIAGLSSQLDKYSRPLFAELSSFDVFARSPQFEDQKRTLAKAHGLHEELLEQNLPESIYFDERRWTFADKKVLLWGLATARLNLEENLAAKRLSLDEEIPYKGMHIRVRDAQVAVVEIARLVREAPGGEGL